MKSRIQPSETSTTKDAIAHQQLWQQIPEKTQETVSGGIREGGRTVGSGVVTEITESSKLGHLAIIF